MTKYPIYPHLGMSEEDQEKICEELFSSDPPILRHIERIEQQTAKLDDYEKRTMQLVEKVRELEVKEDDLGAELRTVQTLISETKGLISGLKYHTRMAKERIKEAQSFINKRQKQVYLLEAQRRLRQLGAELKLGPGRPTQKGPPAPPKHEDQETQ